MRFLGGRWIGVVAAAAVVLAGTSCTAPAPRGSFAVGGACRPVLLVTARGSGETPRGIEVRNMSGALRSALGTAAVQHVELGDLDDDGVADPGGYSAPDWWAVPGLDPSADAAMGDSTVLGGWNESRRVGADELVAVLASREAACPRQRIVLGGYSMGATTIGTALGRLPASVVDRIDAVEFFGDPTNVVGPWTRAPGAAFPTGIGFLGGRSPYVPDVLAARTTSWCGSGDPMCTGNPLLLVVDLLPCDALPREPTCHHRHTDYQRWAIGPAMASAAVAVRSHTP